MVGSDPSEELRSSFIGMKGCGSPRGEGAEV